jgi:hypothetical protein
MNMLGIAKILVQIQRRGVHWNIADLREDALVIVEEDIKHTLFDILEQIRDGYPPFIFKVLRLINDDGVKKILFNIVI